MRIVLDTNILISACMKPDGLEARVVGLAIQGRAEACVTEEVWAEYLDVLLRDKFRAWRERAESLLEALDRRAARVPSGTRAEASLDEDDNRFLECAASAGADFLITGNLRHFPPEWLGTQILNSRMFFDSGHAGSLFQSL
ncbi:MAG TPA: putative toxin-antitoxin system toxin component, PIN family [Bryobacteraceae bacterium]|nr:putative toxin-antitoxin system toxin component, PIN family [Bryobacteraceae bacterium]